MAHFSIITDEFTQDLTTAISFAHTYGLEGLELRTLDNLPMESQGTKRLKEIASILKSEGLVVSDLAGSFNKCLYKDRQNEPEKFRRLLEAAEILESPFIRCFGFIEDDSVTKDMIAEAYKEPLEEAQQSGKLLLLEADPSVTTTNHRQLAELIEYIDHPCLKAIYDPGNDIYDPKGEIPYPDGYKAIQSHIAHVHIKDAVLGVNGAECVRIGTGLVDYPSLLKALSENGYDGFFSLETHYRSGRMISESQMQLPGGASFSEGGLLACEESMTSLIDLVHTYGR